MLKRNPDTQLVMILVALALLANVRLFWINDIFWDDHNWLQSLYVTHGLQDFLNTGFVELRRTGYGSFIYYLLSLHKVNTDLFYGVLHAVNFTSVILTPVVFYLFVRNLLDGNRRLAFCAAAAFVVFPLDHTLPYASASHYRVAMLLSSISFYLMERGIRQSHGKQTRLFMSLLASALAMYIFVEAMVALEPARLLIINHLREKDRPRRHNGVQITLRQWLPYALLCVPLVIYKIVYPPYGIYAGMYQINLLFFLDMQQNLITLAHFLFFPWLIFSAEIDALRPISIVIGFGVTLAGFVWLAHLSRNGKKPAAFRDPRAATTERQRNIRQRRFTVLLGVVFLVPAVLIFQIAGRPVTWGLYSSHGAPAQFGYALLLGVLFSSLLAVSLRKTPKGMATRGLVVILMGLGIFFSNVNLDLYLKSSELQKRFWQSFTERFPTLPGQADFVFDVQFGTLYADSLQYAYNFEFPLNLLFARSERPQEFRSYRAYTAAGLHHTTRHLGLTPDDLNKVQLQRMTWHGRDVIDPKDFILVHYRNGQDMLVNREIAERYPKTAHRVLLDKPFPTLPMPAATYPLRGKQPGFETNKPR